MVINCLYKPSISCLNQCCFLHKKKTSVCFVVTYAAIAVCRTPIVDGPWRVAVCVSPHAKLVKHREECFWKFNPNWHNKVLIPNIRPHVAAIGHITLKSTSIIDRNFLITWTPTQINLVTLKMEAALFSESLIHLTTAQCRNREEGHHPIDNRCEVPKNYKKVQAGLLKYFTIELKMWASLLRTGDVKVFPVDCCCSSECRTAASCKLTACADNTILFLHSEPFQRFYVYQLKPGLHHSWATKICTVALNIFRVIIPVYFHTHKKCVSVHMLR